MEVQTCAFESPTITNSNYYYGKINIGSVIMCFLIIYSTAISIVLSVKQLIQVIKEEELIQEMEDEEDKVDVQTQVIKEVVKVDVQTQVDKEEEEKERKKREQKEEEEEMLLANYNAKERGLALQTAYEEHAKLAFEKWQEAYHKLFIIQKQKYDSHHPDNSDYLSLMSKVQEEYLETNEKFSRYEAFNALKKTRLINLNYHTAYAHLFNS